MRRKNAEKGQSGDGLIPPRAEGSTGESPTSIFRREAHIKDVEAKYRGMFENAVEGIYQSTPDGRYMAVNPALAKMYGYDSPEDLLRNVSDIQNQIYMDPSFRARFMELIDQQGQVRGLEYQVRRRDGSIFWIAESARLVRDAAGAVRYYEGFIEDITPRKTAETDRARLEKQMVQAQKMEAVGLLAGGVAHDFNNILCAMLGFTDLALADDQITGTTRRNLQQVVHSAKRAAELVRRILTFSRQTEIRHNPLRLGPLLRESAKLLNAALPSTISVEITMLAEDDTIVADPTEIHQVIMNLGTNSGHAMRKNGGRLSFAVQALELGAAEAETMAPLRAGPHVKLTVNDTGHGMSRAVLDKIFDPFFTTKPPGEGTGLGLTLVQTIVARSNGFVTLESAEGVGTTFSLWFPRVANAALVPDAARPRLLPGKREWLLVVDDEAEILHMMQQYLRKMNYRVFTRADSMDALATFRAEPDRFAAVITDHTMPLVQGVELAEKLGEIRPQIPVILMTGMNQLPDFAGSPHAARRAVVRKPIDFADLSHRLRRLLDKP